MLTLALVLAGLPPGPVRHTPPAPIGGELVSLPDPSRELPTDPFLRCAVKALRGDFGKLKWWQEEAYRRGLAMNIRAEWPLLLTQYNANEGRQGRVDCHGNKCGWHTAASNLIPQGYAVWTPQVGLRLVCDRGSRRNDRIAVARGRIWVDIWFPTARHARAAGIDGWVPTRGAIIPLP